MSLTLGYLLATVGAQAGSAYFNCKRSSKQAKELARKQQEYEERVMQKGIANAQKEFAEVCALQREVESQMQLDRTQMIRDNHIASLLLDAYRNSLENWPLFVPPFIIKNEGLPLLDSVKQDETQTIPVNCILTPSMDSSFNLKIFPKLEERLAQFFSKYWATNSLKAIRFYQNAWRNNISDVGSKMHDLKAHLNEVPTIVISPLIEDNMLLFSFSWWGFSNNPDDEHIMEADNIYNPELSIEVTNSMTYNTDIIETILSEATPKIAAFISFFADLYYWNFYHIPPSLPRILASKAISLDCKSRLEHTNYYKRIVSNFEPNKEPALIEQQMSFLNELIKVCDIDAKENVVAQYFSSLNSYDTLPIALLNAIKIFLHNNQISENSFDFSHILNEEIEEVQIVEGVNLDDETIKSVFEELSVNAFSPSIIPYIYWTDNIVIGTFCTSEGELAMYSNSNSSHFVVLMGNKASLKETSTFQLQRNPINYIYKKNQAMEKIIQKESFKARIGRRLIQVGNRLTSYEDDGAYHPSTKQNDPWGNGVQEKNKVDEIQSITSFFINGVDSQSIPYSKQSVSMSLDTVLNWLDALGDVEVGQNNQVYIVKSKHQDSGKIIYCTFLAKNDIFDLNSSPKICFVCDAEPQELKSLFNNKLVYVIPFE